MTKAPSTRDSKISTRTLQHQRIHITACAANPQHRNASASQNQCQHRGTIYRHQNACTIFSAPNFSINHYRRHQYILTKHQRSPSIAINKYQHALNIYCAHSTGIQQMWHAPKHQNAHALKKYQHVCALNISTHKYTSTNQISAYTKRFSMDQTPAAKIH